MNDSKQNINIKFDDDFNIDIDEQELIKNIDFTQFNKNMNDNYIPPNESNIIPAAELITNNDL